VKAIVLVEDLERRGVRLRGEGDRLIVDAPVGVLTDEITSALATKKLSVLRILSEPRNDRSLAEVAADRLPVIRLTIRETEDTARDFDLLGRVRRVIQEFQPGGNHVYLRIVTLDQRRVVVEWRALADRELRVALARLVAANGQRQRRA
jgi:hypothetical protein